MYIAFQKCNNKSFIDRSIKFFTKSEIVHCEIVTLRKSNKFYGYTADFKDGVRAKWVQYDPKEWELIRFDGNLKQVKAFYEKTKNCKYDYLGILGFIFGNKDNPRRYFCSEWCAKALNIDNASKLSPGKLYEIFKTM